MKDFLGYLSELWKTAGYSGIAAFIGALAAIVGLTSKLLSTFLKQRKQRKQLRDLHPFYTEQDTHDAIQYYIETKCQTEAPSKKDEPEIDPAPKEESISFFIKKVFKPGDTESSRFHIILGGSGMGKTTFLINLYLRYIDQFVKPSYGIELLPLGYPKIDEKITAIEDKSNTILLLDAFDEDTQALPDHRSRLHTLVELTKEFRKVLITCRTQFFPSEEEEPKETGVLRFGPKGGQHVFRKLYLSPFDKEDIQDYLKKRFSWLQRAKRRRAQQIVLSCPSLMVRPMLLSHIEDLLQRNDSYTATYMVYAELIQRWIEREAHKFFSDRPTSYMKDLYQFSREIALHLYRHRAEQQGLWMNAEEIQTFANRHGIKKLSDVEMKSKSLLNRNAQGQYKFSHKSILEYFLAKEAFERSEFREELNFDGMSAAKTFFEEMVWEKLTVPFFSRGDVAGDYTVKDGTPRTLVKLDKKILPDITTLNLDHWDSSQDPLLFSGLSSLQLVEVEDTLRWAILHGTHNTTMFQLDENWRPKQYIDNHFEQQDVVVLDHSTGLTWERAGSEDPLTYADAQIYVHELNLKEFAGHTDWRLPTIPELMSLLEPKKQSNELYLNPIFPKPKKYGWYWSATKKQIKGKSSPGSAWLVDFDYGHVPLNLIRTTLYVRCVRS